VENDPSLIFLIGLGEKVMPEKTSNTKMKNRCPHCSEVVEVDTGMVGEMTTCPNEDCQKVFRISIPHGKAVQQDPDPQDTHSLTEDDNTARLVSDEELLLQVHPAFLRRRPLKSLVVFAMGIFGLYLLALWAGLPLGWASAELASENISEQWKLWIGGGLVILSLLIFFSWWLAALFTTMRVTNKRTTFRKGIISRETSEVLHEDVRNLQIDQNILERIFFIGDIALSSSGQDDLEIEAIAIPSPERIATTIRQYQ
jgi:hypothetical protein